ncbi:MAG: T9SS type A sorting domain-containing protein [Bacteroidales bacterium]|nr:T9SS type A sorting domain-containing protein [Bacteroidales bacterium]
MKKITKYFLFLIFQILFLQAFSQDFWELITTEPDSTCARCMHISSLGDIYLGMWGFDYPGGIYRSTDNAQTWEYLGLTEKTVYAVEVCLNGDIITGVKNGIYKSNDSGFTWYQTYWPVGNITNLLSLPNGYVFAGGVDNLHGIIRSKDFGETWDTVHVFTNYGQENLKCFAVSAEGHIWAGTYNIFGEGSIWFTTDLGESWTQFNIPGSHTWVFALAFHPQGDLFAGFYGGGLYRYNFTTQQWTALYYPDISPDDILFIGNNKIFIGFEENPNNWGGVLFSGDNGQNFEWINSGLIGGGVETSINYLFRHTSNFLYALGNGFYRSIDTITTRIKEQPVYQIKQSFNYPNPFTDKTVIHWDNYGKDEYVDIVIIDAKGTNTLNEKIENTGSYIFQNNLLKPGIFYYSIVGKNNIYSGKMICAN